MDEDFRLTINLSCFLTAVLFVNCIDTSKLNFCPTIWVSDYPVIYDDGTCQLTGKVISLTTRRNFLQQQKSCYFTDLS